jgi:hypothetical protein
MDKTELINRRRKRYLAQAMEEFETKILPLLPANASAEVDSFKGTLRQKFNALAVDAAEFASLGEGETVNGFAIEAKDRAFPHGRTGVTRT